MYNFKFYQACMGQTQLVSFWERRRHCEFLRFFLFSMCSHQVFTVFPSSSQWVPNMITNMFLMATHFVLYAWPSVVLFEPIYVSQYLDLSVSIFEENISTLGSLKSFRVFL
jgi:hypothetical protein